MTTAIPFFKVHGLGNDFIVVDALLADPPLERLLDPAVVRGLCDRHTGVGADGILPILPPVSAGADARMRVLNADGSEAEMCGNGIRCVARVMREHMDRFRGRERLTIDTGAGALRCRITEDAHGRVGSVAVDMGAPRLARAEIPMTGGPGEGRFVEQPVEVGGRPLLGTAVSMGNPHLVFFVDQPPEALARAHGPELEHHPLFPNRTNVEFAAPASNGRGLELWVWERGCGITRACGTGACATAVAAVVTGRHPEARPLTVNLPGGPLTITVAQDLAGVLMDGPAQEVFTGVLRVPDG